jgi:hypothetical protein
MIIDLPRREKAAAKTGPRLEISPLELEPLLKTQHGLSSLLLNAESWEPFAWKGNDLSAPLRALWVAESRGLLQKQSNRSSNIAIADIASDINAYLMQFGKKTVSESSVHGNLKTASLYLQAALGVALIPDKPSMSVRFMDTYETAENIERYFDSIKSKLQKLGKEVRHAEACRYDVSHVLGAFQEATGMKVLSASSSD